MLKFKDKQLEDNKELDDKLDIVNDDIEDSVIEDNDAIIDDLGFENTDDVILEESNTHLDIENDTLIENNVNLDDNKDNKKELRLFIISDRKNPLLLSYARELGVKISKIFYNIEEAKDTFLLYEYPMKIVIVDTGTGKFSSVGSRKQIIDLIGICDDDTMISVYYTDTVIKSDIELNDSNIVKNIHWHKYKSSIDLVAHLLNNKSVEKYVYDKEYLSDDTTKCDAELNYKGLRTDIKDDNNIGEPILYIDDIITNMNNLEKGEEIQKYKIKV